MTRSTAAFLLTVFAFAWPARATDSAACAPCHAAIYRNYMRTSMARSSGRVEAADLGEKFDRNEFRHDLSGVRYRVEHAGNRRSFRFEFTDAGVPRQGSRPLEYFIG